MVSCSFEHLLPFLYFRATPKAHMPRHRPSRNCKEIRSPRQAKLCLPSSCIEKLAQSLVLDSVVFSWRIPRDSSKLGCLLCECKITERKLLTLALSFIPKDTVPWPWCFLPWEKTSLGLPLPSPILFSLPHTTPSLPLVTPIHKITWGSPTNKTRFPSVCYSINWKWVSELSPHVKGILGKA